MNYRNLMAMSLGLALSAVVSFGQGGPPPPGGPGGPHWFHEGLPGIRGHKEVVTGSPYSATLSNSVTRTLADGNSIQRTTTGQVARDSQGRTYEQITVTGGPLGATGSKTLTFINDPVAGYAYSLDSSTKVAMQRALPAPGSHPNWNADGAKPHRSQSDVVKSDLPVDSSSGVAAQGTSITHTIPAGSMGNAQPIVQTTQTWYSSDLHIVVKSVRNDPFSGQSTYTLTGIKMQEPDASLFKVPAGYTVKTAPEHFGPPPPPPGE